ncbi:unnamed protein product [Pylaiella littoralis]
MSFAKRGLALSSRAGVRVLASSGSTSASSTTARGLTTGAAKPPNLAIIASGPQQHIPSLSDSFITLSASIHANTINNDSNNDENSPSPRRTTTVTRHGPGSRRYASTCTGSASSTSSTSADGSSGTDSSSTDSNISVSGPAAKRVLYGGHQPTSPLQRTAMAGWAAVTALMKPERADMVATLGEVTGRLALERLYRSMLADPEGREILRARPVINESTVDLAALAALPDGTFGKSYSNFMKGNKFSPDSRSPVQYVDDPDLAYVMRRYREVHDLWHVLSDLPPTVEGELALKWFELVQTGLPMCALGAVFGPLALPRREPLPPPPPAPTTTSSSSSSSSSSASDKRKKSSGRNRGGSREVLARTYVPWAVRAGRQARKPLVCVWYERRWEQPLEQVRRELGFEVAPRRGEGGEAPVPAPR